MISLLNQIALAVSGWTELSIVVKATLILLAGLVGAMLARRSTSSVRHLLLAAVFVAILVLPVVVFSVPEVVVPVDVWTASQRGPAVAAPIDGPVNGGSRTPWANDSASRSAQPTPAFSAASVVRIVWLSGVALLLASLAFEMWRLRCLRRKGLPAPELHGLLQETRGAMHVRRRVELLLHEDISAPLTCGLLRPVILMPSDATEWSENNLRRALIHELEHVRRGDWAMQLIARTTCAVYWFHPLAWMAWRRLALEAERACDDAVVRREDGADYATLLLSLARKMSGRTEQPALGMAKRGDLSARVTAVLDGAQRREPAGFFAAAVIIGTTGLIVLGLGPVRAVAQQSSSWPQSTSRYPELDRALFDAAEKGDVVSMQRLVPAGANVNAELSGDGSPLIAAARKGKDDAVTFLVDRGADPNLGVGGDGSPLIMASRNGHLATVKLLLQRGADIHKSVPGDGNPLIMAARGGHVNVVEFLLDRGANLEQVVPGDENALIEASASGHLAVAKLLVARGANVNARVWSDSGRDASGEWRTPLGMALRRQHADVVSFLRSAGARE